MSTTIQFAIIVSTYGYRRPHRFELSPRTTASSSATKPSSSAASPSPQLSPTYRIHIYVFITTAITNMVITRMITHHPTPSQPSSYM
eukprot:2468903-Pyramimonas_sp.AAC.1